MKNDNRRSRLVNKSLQYKFLAMFLVYSFVIVCFLFIFLFVPDIVQMNNQQLSLNVRATAADRILFRHIWVWPTVFILIGLFALHSFRSFWRVIGPLYRFHTVFDRVANGELTFPIRIRKKDYLKPEEKTLNRMLATLGEKIDRIRQTAENALSSADELERILADESGESDAIGDFLSAHRRDLEELLETVRYFRVQRLAPSDRKGPESGAGAARPG